MAFIIFLIVAYGPGLSIVEFIIILIITLVLTLLPYCKEN